ncbi:DUF3194 domain-containing protein [Halobaculum sp. WSA2]|uniref:DUF3194 domain-containing protein n=1 Tax=Halobaculum saliterrae TaxID=2073113 RepID=A0A6B0SWN0_9EURY|nr:DUF3194 domain-containing protein [Halobaculum saliterrae]MXR41936.1 DUF3194 domain-containing protein [Halobaculum saliterrae]
MSDDRPEPTDEEVVETASEAAEGVVLDRYRQSELRDFDVTVTFEDGVLDVDVYVNPPADAEVGADEVAEEAVGAARDAVDELFGVA